MSESETLTTNQCKIIIGSPQSFHNWRNKHKLESVSQVSSGGVGGPQNNYDADRVWAMIQAEHNRVRGVLNARERRYQEARYGNTN